jgi:hypothetical protein
MQKLQIGGRGNFTDNLVAVKKGRKFYRYSVAHYNDQESAVMLDISWDTAQKSKLVFVFSFYVIVAKIVARVVECHRLIVVVGTNVAVISV